MVGLEQAAVKRLRQIALTALNWIEGAPPRRSCSTDEQLVSAAHEQDGGCHLLPVEPGVLVPATVHEVDLDRFRRRRPWNLEGRQFAFKKGEQVSKYEALLQTIRARNPSWTPEEETSENQSRESEDMQCLRAAPTRTKARKPNKTRKRVPELKTG